MDLEYVRGEYRFEFERKQHLTTSALTLPTAIVMAIGSLLSLLGSEVRYESDWIGVCILASLVAASLLFLVAVLQLCLSYYGQKYEYVPRAKTLKEYHDQLTAYCAETGGGETEVEQDYQDFLFRKYIEATDRNSKSNDAKAGYLAAARSFIIFTLVPTFLCSTLFIIQSRMNPTKEVYEVHVQNLPEVASLEGPAMREEAKKKPPKPKEPENRVLKEEEQPKDKSGTSKKKK